MSNDFDHLEILKQKGYCKRSEQHLRVECSEVKVPLHLDHWARGALERDIIDNK